jgi:hypothetical protein
LSTRSGEKINKIKKNEIVPAPFGKESISGRKEATEKT